MNTTVVPGGLDTSRGPPLRLPLVHFLVGLALLVAGAGVGLAAGRLLGAATLARAGAVAAGLCVAAACVVLTRTLAATRGGRRRCGATPSCRRRWSAGWRWRCQPGYRAPLAPGTALSGPAARPLLALGAVGLVVAGTLYHVVPFLVWVERYSDRLGLADVPVVEELYDERLVARDLICLAGVAVLVAGAPVLPAGAGTVGSGAVLAGAGLLAANMLVVVRGHVPGGVAGLLTGRDRVDGSAPAEGGG